MAKRRQSADGADPNKTATLLDLLEAKRLIDRRQYDAGRYFGWLRRRIYGRAHLKALNPTRVNGRGTDADKTDWARLEAEYRQVCAALTAESDGIRRIAEDICVFDRCPALPARSEAGAGAVLQMLRVGLDAINRIRGPEWPTGQPGRQS